MKESIDVSFCIYYTERIKSINIYEYYKYMILIEKHITCNQQVPYVFQKLFEDNRGIFDDHMKLIKWDKHEWKVKKKIKQRKEDIYTYIPMMPDEMVKYTQENDKYLNVQVKNKIMVDTPDYQKIKTKFKILNVNPFLRTVFNDLHIIDTRNVMEIQKIDDNTTSVKVTIRVRLKIPRTKVVEQFIAALCDSLTQSAITALQKTVNDV
jgi:hypothetical protein